MSDKKYAPRMREQYEDNAVEVAKNEPVKAERRFGELRDKVHHTIEMDECPETSRDRDEDQEKTTR